MEKIEKSPRWLKVLLIGFAILLLADFSLGCYVKNEIGNQSTQNQYAQKHQSAFPGPVLRAVGSVLHNEDKEIVAAATVGLLLVTAALAIYTARLWGTTKTLLKQADDTAKAHERAYILGGAPFGVLKDEEFASFAARSPMAIYFRGPWQMTLLNYGRTPGFVTEIKWGLCRDEAFNRDIPVSEIVKHPKKWLPKDAVFEIPENVDDAFPPNDRNRPVRNRHVQFEDRDQYIGWVFFGRIDYKDIFNKPHHSTFKLLLTQNHSDPLPGCYSDADGKS